MQDFKILSKVAAKSANFKIGSHVQFRPKGVEGVDYSLEYDSTNEPCHCPNCDDNTDRCIGCGHSMTNRRRGGNGVCCTAN